LLALVGVLATQQWSVKLNATTTTTYPPTTGTLKTGDTYAWQVVAMRDRDEVDVSDMRSFANEKIDLAPIVDLSIGVESTKGTSGTLSITSNPPPTSGSTVYGPLGTLVKITLTANYSSPSLSGVLQLWLEQWDGSNNQWENKTLVIDEYATTPYTIFYNTAISENYIRLQGAFIKQGQQNPSAYSGYIYLKVTPHIPVLKNYSGSFTNHAGLLGKDFTNYVGVNPVPLYGHRVSFTITQISGNGSITSQQWTSTDIKNAMVEIQTHVKGWWAHITVVWNIVTLE
jgi:hypothetical protein